jgi:hypothetical protein
VTGNYTPHLLQPLIQRLEVDLDESGEFMIKRIRHKKCVYGLVASSQLRGRGLNAGYWFVIRERGV